MKKLPQKLVTLLLNEKGLIISGEPASGKTRLANFIAEHYQSPKFFLASDFKKGTNRFSFMGCEKNTGLVIIEECPPDFDFEVFFFPISKGIRVENRGQESFDIKSKMLFVSTQIPKFKGLSFDRRFDIFDLRDN